MGCRIWEKGCSPLDQKDGGLGCRGGYYPCVCHLVIVHRLTYLRALCYHVLYPCGFLDAGCYRVECLNDCAAYLLVCCCAVCFLLDCHGLCSFHAVSWNDHARHAHSGNYFVPSSCLRDRDLSHDHGLYHACYRCHLDLDGFDVVGGILLHNVLDLGSCSRKRLLYFFFYE